MKTGYRSSIITLSILMLSCSIAHSMSRKDALYKKTKEALTKNNPKELASLLNSYNEAYTFDKKSGALKKDESIVIDQKEEIISPEELNNSILPMVELKHITRGGKLTTNNAQQINPNLIELLQEAQLIIQQREEVANSGFTKVTKWPTKAKISFFVGIGLLSAALTKGGFDIFAKTDGSNKGWKWYADIAGDVFLALSSIMPIYEGATNREAKFQEAQAHQNYMIVQKSVQQEINKES